jgi:hypothetical protein
MSGKTFENALNELYLASSEYCKLLENLSATSKADFLSGAQKLLNLVYLKAGLMKKPEQVDEGEAEKFVLEDDWEYIKDQASSKLGLSDKFIELTLPENEDPDNFESLTLAECFADVYQDLRNFATSFEIGNEESMRASLFDYLENFEKFWGIRALAIMSTIHNLIYGGDLSKDEFDDENENIDKKSIDTSNWLINKRFNNGV